jgi:Leucine-rich repeat (LRR) protein
LTDELLLKITGQEELDHITVLNLHGNGLTKLKSLQPLRMLKRLIVSFNELTRLDELAHMVKLQFFHANFLGQFFFDRTLL